LAFNLWQATISIVADGYTIIFITSDSLLFDTPKVRQIIHIQQALTLQLIKVLLSTELYQY